MSLEHIVLILLLAFVCELIDSSLGMLYGTILSPVLIIVGYDPLIVVPSILLSQAASSLLASFRHKQFKNIELYEKKGEKKKLSQDSKVIILIGLSGIVTTIIAAFIAVSIPKQALKIYIGALVLVMGVILLIKTKYKFSWNKIFVVGVISAFNKAISGGGFGPVVTTGQIISGRPVKKSIASTLFAEFPICIAGFITYLILNGLSDWNLVIYTSIGALLAAYVGPYITSRIKSEKKLILALGIIVTLLGIWTILKTIL
ncbi:MAG: sulfite exporter TauE/SafE family protein [Candidatus Marinimicrobia bacterium]|nr:sulfite exporter TauE/SafE family protein [Candidatus Neomarinimicrobiota bacterium]